MANSGRDLRSLGIAELVETYGRLVEEGEKRSYSPEPLPAHLSSRPYLDEIKRRGEGSNPQLMQFLEHPNLSVCVAVAIDFLEADVEPRLARAALWEIACLRETAGMTAFFYLASTDREWQEKHKVPISDSDDPTPDSERRIGGQAKWSLDLQRLGKRPQDKH
ncbi:MAG: hypothetical protein FJX54_04680 [Alphaproteobacteria bacterium]|nr:hypothetical protein [Alphaproteobacteria bacterium]